jgi:hypothetical protein
MNRNRKFWIMDYETIINCFIAVFEDYKSSERRVFVINREINQFKELIAFFTENLNCKDWHFGYNVNGFDGQITQYLLENYDTLLSKNSEQISLSIYNFAQKTIHATSNGGFPDYPEYKLSIPTVDIFKLNHWDSNAKRSSLKWVQYAMDWYNVEEMPHPYYKPVTDDQTLEMVVNYCINDVQSTKSIFNFKDKKGEKVMISQINLRSELSQKYDLQLYSASEPRISKEMFLHFLSEKLKWSKKKIKNMKTERDMIYPRDLILPYIKFETPEFKSVLNWFKSLQVDTKNYSEEEENKNKNTIKYSLTHKGVKTDYGLGGLHGCIKSGVYTSSEDKIILSADVASFYPNMAIKNKWAPEHLPKEQFAELYEWFYIERKKYPKSSPLNYLFKIILNATYGLSKSQGSFLYDPEFTFRITVNGQLLLSMLYEMLSLGIPDAKPLMQNTDGLEFLVDRKDEQKFYDICKTWEQITDLVLETVKYDKMIIADVNNYIAVYENGKTKCKGRFEFEDLPLHKNKSFLVIPKAWYEYFVKGISPEEYIKTNRNIFDYCAGAKLKGDWYFVERSVKDNTFSEKKQQKLIRYYISERGSKLVKCHPDGREIQLESGKPMQNIFNKFVEKPWQEYGVDEQYYLKKIKEEIFKIENGLADATEKEKKEVKSNQLSMFL